MKKLFLSSSFKDVANILPFFVNEPTEEKTVTFIPTAALHEKINFYAKSGKRALEKMGMIVHELEISKATLPKISDNLKNNDYIYVSGGNAFFLLQELKKTGADKIIAKQVNLGKLYIGESAGSVILSPNIDYIKDMNDAKDAPLLENFKALNLIDFHPLPHHKKFPFKKTVEKIITKYEPDLPLKFPSNNSFRQKN